MKIKRGGWPTRSGILLGLLSTARTGAAQAGAIEDLDRLHLRDLSDNGSAVVVQMTHIGEKPADWSFRLSVLDARTLQPRLRLARNFGLDIITWSTALSPDGRLLAVGGERRQGSASRGSLWQLWDVARGKMVRSGRTARGMMSQAIFSPDGRTLALVNDKMSPTGRYGWVKVFLLDVASGRTLRELRAPMTYAGVQFSDDGRYLAGLGDVRSGRITPYPEPGAIQGRGLLWEAATGKQLALWRFPNARMFGPRFVPGAVGELPRLIGTREAQSQEPVLKKQRQIEPEVVMWDALGNGNVPLRLLARPQEFPPGIKPERYAWTSGIHVATDGRSFRTVVEKHIENQGQPRKIEKYLMTWPLAPLADGRLDDGAIQTTLEAKRTPPQSAVLLEDPEEKCVSFLHSRDGGFLVAYKYPTSVVVFDPQTGKKLRERSIEPD